MKLILFSALSAIAAVSLSAEFDFDCAKALSQDQNAMDALSDLANLRLDEIQVDETDGIFNFESLLISEKISCVKGTSTFCQGTVDVIPPEDQLQVGIDQIIEEVNNMSDDQLLNLLDYDINALCLRVNQIDVSLSPHYSCIDRNVQAFSAANKFTKAAIELTLKALGLNIDDFSSGLVSSLIDGCGSFKSSLATSLRSQLTSQFWEEAIKGYTSPYTLESFNSQVQRDQELDYKQSLGCTIPDELICSKYVSSFAASCLMITRRQLTFIGPDWETANSDVSQSLFYKYPCDDTFQDTCMGTYLADKPNLNLNEQCGSLAHYYSLTGETPPAPTPAPTPSSPSPSPTPTQFPTSAPSDAPTQEPSSSPTEKPTVSPTDATPNDGYSDKKKISGGLVALIVLVVVAVVIAFAFIGYLYKTKRIPGRGYQIQLS